MNKFFNHGIHKIGGMFISLVALFGFAASAIAAEPGISVEARQRYPWNGLVDLKFTISGTSGTKYDTSFTAKDLVGGTNIMMNTIRKSDGSMTAAKEQLLPGTYNWIWDAAADLPMDFECERMTVSGKADVSAFPYTVKFNANGGTGTMASQSFTYGTANALSANAFTRTGYAFLGWATSANGAKVYNDAQSVKNLTTTSGAVVNLYALWEYVCDKFQLWEGGPYWASTNIGAGKPEDYGYYFWWGDTVGYKWVNNKWVASDGLLSNFSFIMSNTPTWGKNLSALQRNGWITVDGVLSPSYDAAYVQWGGSWRMPTKAEMDALGSNCDWTWTTKNGVNGCVIRGRGDYAQVSIFLPCAGFGSGTSRSYSGSYGYYWLSIPYSEDTSLQLIFCASYEYTGGSYRYLGQTIRPVQSFAK